MNTKILALLCALKVSTFSFGQAESYWQQYVDYEIHVTLDDQSHRLNGNIQIQYTNNAPESLSEIRMHLWPNAYENPHTELGEQFIADKDRQMLLAKAEDLGYMDSLSFQVNGSPVSWEYHPEDKDIAILKLSQPLQSGQVITISTPFRVKIPSSDFSRLGHSEQAYQLTQWYPKPAVYDKNGWHDMPYLNQGEFYSEFGNFDVYITVPSNYIIAASGELQNADERAYLLNLAEETAKRTSFGTDLTFPPSDETTKTLHYKMLNAHDFAWFADKRFHVLHGEMQLPYSGRTVETWSYFTNLEASLWMKSIEYLNRSVMAYSNYVGEYQWSVAQAVEGALSAGAGMEYPTITIIGQSGNGQALDNVITHEVGHNWFYGMLGSNERDYAWMDEGINSYYENRYMTTYYGSENPLAGMLGPLASLVSAEDLGGRDLLDLSWYLIGGLERMNKSQAIEQHSNDFTQINYGILVYQKTAYLMRYMADFLGQGQFDRVMSRYFEEWKMKHPQPEDIRRVFEEETGENMAWFFDGLLQSDRSLDYRIKEVMNGQTTLAVRVQNNTDIAGPFPLSVMIGDSVIRTEWHRGFTGAQTIYVKKLSVGEEITHVRIDANENTPDNNRENNISKVDGLLKKVEPLALKPLFGLDNPERTTVYYSPLIGFNTNDHLMLGLGLWNSTFPAPKLEWVAAPMYSFEAKDLVGQASVGINLYPQNGPLDRLRVSAFGAKYHIDSVAQSFYTKFQPTLDANFRGKKFKSPINHAIRLRTVRIEESRNLWVGPIAEEYITQVDTFWYNELQYQLTNKHVQHPYRFTATVQQGADLLKMFAELNYNIPIRKWKLETRLFFGWMDYLESDPYSRYAYSLTGVSSYNDYLYDDILAGRNAPDGMWSNQITRRDGFLKLPTDTFNLGYSSETMLALNLEMPVPKLPLALFADVAYLPGNSLEASDQLQYDAGVMLRLLNNYLEVYFPLIASEGLQDPFGGKYGESISFMINLNAMNPFELMRKLDL